MAGRSVRRSSCGCHCYHTRAAESLARRSHTALMSYGGGCTHTHTHTKKEKKKHHISATLNTNSDTRPGHTYMLSPPILRASTHTPGTVRNRGSALRRMRELQALSFHFLDKHRKTSRANCSETSRGGKARFTALKIAQKSPAGVSELLHHCHNGPLRPVVFLKSFR